MCTAFSRLPISYLFNCFALLYYYYYGDRDLKFSIKNCLETFFYNIDLDIILQILHQDMSKNDF
jgi:hypothetical protein